MKKIFLSLVSAFLLIPVVGSSVSVQASTWHNGSPKITRGIWTDKSKYPKGAMYDSIYITKNKFTLNDRDPSLIHLRYKKFGKGTYKFRGYEAEARRYESTPKIHFTKHSLKVHWYGNFHLIK